MPDDCERKCTDKLLRTGRQSKLEHCYIRGSKVRFIVLPDMLKNGRKLNVSGAIPAVLLGAGFPVQALKGVPILARTAGLIAHMYEEIQQPIGFALSYQATRDVVYEGDVPAGFGTAQRA